MVFSSLLFLFIFLPIFLMIYYIAPRGLRNFILFMASLIFYAWGEPVYVLIMIFSTVLDYTVGRVIDANRNHSVIPKVALGVSMLGNLGMLGFFKYANFFIDNVNNFLNLDIQFLQIALPIGISFYTFQTMSYTIDLYRGKIGVQKNIISFGAYVAMFPQLIAGPIVTYETVEHELNHRVETLDQFSEGIMRFIEGFGKKVLLANNIGMAWEAARTLPTPELTFVGAWFGIIAFALQLYFDFSGYSDMAIGLGKMMGFKFPENFNYPYLSKNVTEFWRRWHMTLGSWFREYLYIPLGGNRVSKPKFYRNLMVVWFLTGFWHGAGWNFVIWGLFFGVLIIVERTGLLKILERLPRFVSHLYLLGVVLISWVLFALEESSHIIAYLKAMFGLGEAGMVNTTALYQLSNYALVIGIGVIFATPLMKHIQGKFKPWMLYIFYVGVILLSTAYLVDSTFNPFLYFRF
ncbi:MAG: MBOAT family O-acyltransferase [Niameybacter sp.]|uniref:MBOAT family O-acyltransferase n=1 Tax=Niameybacter sp. TaxID=2033640 RepID=UPI002FE6D320